jgi:Dna[CI] antecedent, DciA
MPPKLAKMRTAVTPSLAVDNPDGLAYFHFGLTRPSMIRRPFYTLPAKGPPKASSRQRALAQLRGGYNLTSAEITIKNSARSVADVMPRVLKGIRFEKRQEESQILQIWKASIDPTVTAHAQPTGIHKGTLFITVDSNVWLSEIVRYRRKEILNRLQTALGKDVVQKISFRTA